MPHFAFENNKVSSVKLSHLIQHIIFRHMFYGSCESFTTFPATQYPNLKESLAPQDIR